MFFYRVKISYKGSEFYGWQSQPKENKETIQDTIHQALRKIAKFEKCFVIGASRTDAGVHAQGQVAKLCIPKEVDASKLLLGLNSLLPKDIRILDCKQCEQDFNPINDAVTKEYHFYFSNNAVEMPLFNAVVDHVLTPLNLDLVKEACRVFVGEYDFYNFARRDGNALTTNREITKCELLKTKFSPISDDVYYISVEGTGFLRQMVRYMVGAIFAIGHEKNTIEQLREYLQNKKELKFSPKANACGLHLYQINY